ncbi:LLM class F420-dependent oxidoreductase [Acidothermaceae bacterium B102]|nr:LLM class F420-dependent oxidoreductase [Acidothermaceae bacterium B102]
MDIGISVFPTLQSIDVVEFSRAVESRGFESLWVAEHTHIPIGRREPGSADGASGPEYPEHYKHTLDPFVVLTAASIATTTLRLGFGILLIVERDPIVTAKALASLDQLSGGRVMCGVGGGWILPEMENHGTEPKTRFRLLRERILAMRALWTEDEAAFHGEFVSFDPVWSWPKPVQNPFPVFLGGNTIHTMDRVVEFADGWFPTGNTAERQAQLPAHILEFRARCEHGGRGRLPVTIYGPEATQKSLDALRLCGVDRVVLTVGQGSRGEVLAELDQFANLVG